MKLSRYMGILLVLLAFTYQTQAQMSGSYSVPATFSTIAAAINTLNLVGVSGPVTIHISAGYTETVVPGGLKLFSIAGASSSSRVFFQKNGVGANPLLYAFAGGTAIPYSAVQDGVWWLIGADYITIDGIDILDPNTTNPSTMEFGYGLYNASASNGCQNNIIKNCVVTLNYINGTAGSGTGGSRGIESVCASYLTNTVIITPSSSAGTNSYNKFYSNLVRNCHHGITLRGYLSNSPYTLSDTQNDIGGISAATGNTVINFGGGVGLLAAGIRTSGQYALNISFNIIKNNDGLGAEPTNEIYAMYLGDAPGAYTTVNSNTISMITTSTNLVYGIFNKNGSALATMNITNNLFTGSSYPNATVGRMIYDNSSASFLTVSGNLFTNISGGTLSNIIIQTMGANQCAITSNTLSNYSSPGFLSSIRVGNHVNLTVSNNLLTGASSPTSIVTGIDHSGGTSPGTFTISSNMLSNVTATGYIGISTSYTSIVNSISANTIHSISSPPGSPDGLSFMGIDITGINNTITANSIYSISSLASNPALSFIGLTGIRTLGNNNLIKQNKIGGFTSNSIGQMHGIFLQNGSNFIISNNIIGDMYNPNSAISDGLVGIYNYNTSGTQEIYYNSIYLNSVNSNTANFGSCAILFPSTGTVTMRNNILINTSVSSGTGITTVINSPTTSLALYSTLSNNNILYAGTPASNKFIYHDGVNTYTSLTSFKTFVSPREAQSITENTPFITTNANLNNFLNLDPVVPTQAESGAVPISGITIDYAGATRNTITPDIGAWEGNYSQTDIFAPVVASSGFIESVCNIGGRTFTVNLTDFSGVATGSLSPRLYYRVNLAPYSSIQGSLTAGTPTNGIWTFSLTYGATAPDVINYFLASQDISISENLGIYPSIGASATNVNNVSIPPSPSYNFTINVYPTISVSNGTVCSGTTYTLNPSGAMSYTYSGGSAIVSPATATSYSIVGTSTAGCISSNTAIATVSVSPSPTLSVNSGTICSGKSFTINPSGSDTYTYSGGLSVVSPTATALYSVTGTSTLTGCTSAAAISTVQVFITPTISVNSGTICLGTSFTILPTGASSYTISGGSSLVNPSANSVYLVTGTSSVGCLSSNTATSSVVIAPLPTITVNSGSICSTTNFTITPSGASTYVYAGGSAIVSPLSNTVYAITGTSSLGCSSTNTAIASVTVVASPIITVNSGSVCAGQTFTIAPSDPLLTYTFSGGSSLVSPPTTSLYTVAGSNSLGCISNLAVSNVTVKANPVISINSGTICLGTSFTLVPSGAATYTISGNTATVSPLTNTLYFVSGTSTAGCISLISATATVMVAPLPTISISNGTVCSGSVFTLSPSGAASYVYSGGTAFVSPSTNTFYTVSGTSSLGCHSSNSATATLIVYTLPMLGISGTTLICSGETATLTANGAISYTWSNGGNSSIITVSPAATTTYSVTGNDVNGCSATIGYEIIAEECLRLDEHSTILFQASVYPNPNNGSFMISTNVAEKSGLRLYNTMGELVFEQNTLFEGEAIQIPHLATGVYSAEIKNDGNLIHIVKIIKQ